MRVKPKKRLGQNFLVDQNIRKKILSACAFNSEDSVLEIGPGRGEMTREICRQVKRVIAVEIDKALSQALRSKLSAETNLLVVNGDILKTDLGVLLRGVKGKVKVFGNIPYYITTPILERLFKSHRLIATAFLTVQKEFAQRMAAKSGSREYGALSCFVRYYSDAKVLFAIKNSSFWPRPKVDSSFIRLQMREGAGDSRQEACLFAVIHAAFGQRRKKIINSLSRLAEKEELLGLLKDCSISPDARAESLDLADFNAIASRIKKSKKILTKPQ